MKIKISKPKIIAAAITVLYIAILNIFDFNRIPTKSLNGVPIAPYEILMLGIICIMIAPKSVRKKNLEADFTSEDSFEENFFDERIVWNAVKILGWLCLLIFVPLMLIYLYGSK